VITTKGKGYPPAEKDPVSFHGVGPFNPETGDVHSSKGSYLTYTQVFGQTMVKLAREIPCLVGITAAMPQGTGLDAFAKEFPERCYDVGIAEQHGITFAAGLAAEGFVPVVAVYSTFMQRAYDQILHDVCLQKLPVVLALDRGGIVGRTAPPTTGSSIFPIFDTSPISSSWPPRMKTSFSTCSKLRSAAAAGVGALSPRQRLERAAGRRAEEIPLGQAEVLQQGEDLMILAIGSCAQAALRAYGLLRKKESGPRSSMPALSNPG